MRNDHFLRKSGCNAGWQRSPSATQPAGMAKPG